MKEKNEVKEFLDLVRAANHRINLPGSVEIFLLLEDNKKIIDDRINHLFNYLGSDKEELIRILNKIVEMEDDKNV